MACEVELDNVARLANGMNQRVEKMVKPSAWPNAVQWAGEGSGMVFYPARWAKLGVEAGGRSMYVDRYAKERMYKSRKLA